MYLALRLVISFFVFVFIYYLANLYVFWSEVRDAKKIKEVTEEIELEKKR